MIESKTTMSNFVMIDEVDGEERSDSDELSVSSLEELNIEDYFLQNKVRKEMKYLSQETEMDEDIWHEYNHATGCQTDIMALQRKDFNHQYNEPIIAATTQTQTTLNLVNINYDPILQSN